MDYLVKNRYNLNYLKRYRSYHIYYLCSKPFLRVIFAQTLNDMFECHYFPVKNIFKTYLAKCR